MKSVALLIAFTNSGNASFPCSNGSTGQTVVPEICVCHLERSGVVIGIPEIFGFSKPQETGPNAPSILFLLVKTLDCHSATASAKLFSSDGCVIPIEEKYVTIDFFCPVQSCCSYLVLALFACSTSICILFTVS